MKDSGLTLPDDDPGWQTAAVAMSIWIYMIVKNKAKYIMMEMTTNKNRMALLSETKIFWSAFRTPFSIVAF